jgi:hypothetical protein
MKTPRRTRKPPFKYKVTAKGHNAGSPKSTVTKFSAGVAPSGTNLTAIPLIVSAPVIGGPVFAEISGLPVFAVSGRAIAAIIGVPNLTLNAGQQPFTISSIALRALLTVPTFWINAKPASTKLTAQSLSATKPLSTNPAFTKTQLAIFSIKSTVISPACKAPTLK